MSTSNKLTEIKFGEKKDRNINSEIDKITSKTVSFISNIAINGCFTGAIYFNLTTYNPTELKILSETVYPRIVFRQDFDEVCLAEVDRVFRLIKLLCEDEVPNQKFLLEINIDSKVIRRYSF